LHKRLDNTVLEKSISDVNKKIFELLEKAEKQIIKEKEKRAIALLNTKKDDINEYLKTNFEISDYHIGYLSGYPLRMLDAKLKNIESAVLEEKDDKKTGISFEAEVEVTMLVRSLGYLGFGLQEVRKFRIGESESTEIVHKSIRDIIFDSAKMSFKMRPAEKKITIKVKGEAEVELVEKEYKNFRPNLSDS